MAKAAEKLAEARLGEEKLAEARLGEAKDHPRAGIASRRDTEPSSARIKPCSQRTTGHRRAPERHGSAEARATSVEARTMRGHAHKEAKASGKMEARANGRAKA